MPVWELFSRRQNRTPESTVYKYDTLPTELRVQIIHILRDAIGRYSGRRVVGRKTYSSESNHVWTAMRRILTRELGVFDLSPNQGTPEDECCSYIENASPLQALDLVEIAFNGIDTYIRYVPDYQSLEPSARLTPDEAIEELNTRFQRNQIGYRFEAGKLFRLDSDYLHEEVTRPAITLLRTAQFSGPLDEFIAAHEHYRHERYRDAINAAGSSLESTLKSICHHRNWEINPKDGASRLIDTVIDQGLIPNELAGHLGSILSALKSGLPTIRNKLTAHGQGLVPLTIPKHLAGHALHLAAANIVFLIESHLANP